MMTKRDHQAADYRTEAVKQAVASGNPFAAQHAMDACESIEFARAAVMATNGPNSKPPELMANPSICNGPDGHQFIASAYSSEDGHCIQCKISYKEYCESVKALQSPTCKEVVEQVNLGVETDIKYGGNTIKDNQGVTQVDPNTISTGNESGAFDHAKWDTDKRKLFAIGMKFVDPNGTEKQDRDVLIDGLISKVSELEERTQTLELEIGELIEEAEAHKPSFKNNVI